MSQQQTHWKKLTNPNYLGAYSFEAGQDMILTIKSIAREMVTGADGKKDECTVAKFVESVKPMILNATNSKTITKIYGTPFIENWIGRKIQVFSTTVKVAGEPTEALRIRPIIPKQADTAPVATNCTDCTEEIKPFGNMSAQQLSKYTYTKYGKSVCADCAAKLKAIEDEAKIVDPLASPDKEEAEC